ncbi:MAG: glycosyltransferase [Saprospiraceae bacterium]
MKKLKVLKLGWEFPPLISGGLAIACFGIAKALAKQTDLTIILPKASQDSILDNANIIGLNNTDVEISNTTNHSQEEIYKKYNAFARTLFAPGMENVSPYPSFEKTKTEGISSESTHIQTSTHANQISGTSTSSTFFSRFALDEMYGDDVQQKVVEYAEYVAALAANLEFDVIHAHDWMTMLAGIKVKYQSGKPLVIHAHALSYDRAGPDARGWNYDLEKYGMEIADAVIPVSRYTGTIVERHYGINPQKIFPVHNGVEPVKTYREKATFPEKLVLFLGRITGQKGPEFFLEVASKVIAENDNVRFVMAGSGDQLKRTIETGAYQKVGNKFHFTGFLNREKVNKLLAMADVYCMPSVSEPFGLSAAEAAQFGIPCVISKQSGAAEVMKHALTADFWDVNLMAKHITDLLEDEALRKKVIAETFEDIKTCTWDHAVNGIMGAYSYALGYDVKSDPPAEMEMSEPVTSSSAEKKITLTPVAPENIQKDDLKKIEGIGPKIESLLNGGGIYSYSDLAHAKFSKLKTILIEAGNTFQAHDPSTWAEQAELAAEGKWKTLEKLQDELNGGKR